MCGDVSRAGLRCLVGAMVMWVFALSKFVKQAWFVLYPEHASLVHPNNND